MDSTTSLSETQPPGTGKPADADVEQRQIFRDITSGTGVEFSYSNGRGANEYAILESLGGGVGIIDYDLDGQVDVLFAGGGDLAGKTVTSKPCGLFRNLGNLKFRDETATAQLAADRYYTHGISTGDWDADGFDDLAISGYGGVQLFRNLGDGTFEQLPDLITDANHPWSSSLAWADLNGDGHLDLFVVHYVDWSWDKHPLCAGAGQAPREVCAPREFDGITDAVLINDGQGAFVAAGTGIGLSSGGKGLGVVIADIDLDSIVDIYVANDTTDNFLYMNDGRGTLDNVADLAGVAGDDVGVSTGSMGVCVFDANNDGLPDIWVANFEREMFALYRNEGGGLFTHASRQSGIAAVEGRYVGFGTVVVDFDFDGYLDIVVANGHVTYQSPYADYRQQPLLLHNIEGRRFERMESAGYFSDAHTGRGLAHADLNNDGAQDLVVSHLEEPASILLAQSPPHDRWALVKLVGVQSNRSAIGATIFIGGQQGQRIVSRHGGGSYLSQSDSRLLLTFPDMDSREELSVLWPSGLREVFPMVPLGQESIWIEGSGRKL